MSQFKTISPAKFKKLLKSELLIDVRSSEEYELGHIKNASNIDVNSENFLEEIMKIDKNKKLLVYCQSGGRSFFACQILTQLGYEVLELEGGIENWINNKNKVFV